MTTAITYRQLDGPQAREAATALKPVYAAVFSQPPYNEGPDRHEAFVGWVLSESQHPGFDMHLAYGHDQPIGFVYGYTMPPGEWFRGADHPPPPEVKNAAKFAVMEWAVLPQHRHHGIGATLIRSLLDPRPERWAILTVNPATDAYTIYERAGWRHIASTRPSRTWPAMSIMLLDRHDADQ